MNPIVSARPIYAQRRFAKRLRLLLYIALVFFVILLVVPHILWENFPLTEPYSAAIVNYAKIYRDGFGINLLFFAIVGFGVTRAAWKNPQDERFTARMLMMFPRLEHFPDMVHPVREMVQEAGSLTQIATLRITVSDYNPVTKSVRLDVERIERLTNLLWDEDYEDRDYQISISADPVEGYEVLGGIKEIKLKKMSRDRGLDTGHRVENLLQDDEARDILSSKTRWEMRSKELKLPKDHDGEVTLRYWIRADLSKPFISTTRRPTKTLEVELCYDSKELNTCMMVSAYLAPGKAQSKLVELKSNGNFHKIDFKPRSRRPRLEIAFSVPT